MFGLFVAFIVGSSLRILVGFRLNLYLVSNENRAIDQTLIPITAEAKKNSIFRALITGSWYEDVDITLMNFENQAFIYRIGYHFWHRFYIIPKKTNGSSKINKKSLKRGKRYRIRTGDTLQIGGRAFSVLVTPIAMTTQSYREFLRAGS